MEAALRLAEQLITPRQQTNAVFIMGVMPPVMLQIISAQQETIIRRRHVLQLRPIRFAKLKLPQLHAISAVIVQAGLIPVLRSPAELQTVMDAGQEVIAVAESGQVLAMPLW
jgi:hypothetical protein